MRTIVGAFVVFACQMFGQGALANGQRHNGAISNPFQSDSWTFHADAGNQILLAVGEVTDNGSFTPYIQLYRPDGARVGGSSGGTGARLSATAALSGTYRVTVSSAPSAADRTGTYRLTLLIVPGSFIVPVGDQGGEMLNGARHEGSIDAGDIDAWTFTATAGDPLMISIGETIDNNGFAPQIQVLRPDGSPLALASDPTVARIVTSAPVTGIYTVVVSSGVANPEGTGSYRLTLAKVPGPFFVSDADEGGPMLNGARNQGRLYLGDVDMWSFSANAGDRIVLSLTNTNDVYPPTLYPNLQVYRPDGVLVASAFGPYVSQINESAVLSGTYVAIVTSKEAANSDVINGTGTYRLKLAKAPGAFVVSQDDQGGRLENGIGSDGYIDSGDVDIWSFSASAGDKISARLDVTLNPAGAFFPLLQLIGPNGQRIAIAPGSDSSQIVEIAPASGTYTLFASANFGNNRPGNLDASGRYVIRVDVQRNPPTMTSIRITSTSSETKLFQTQQLTATAIYSDGSTEDISNRAIWVSNDTSIAAVNINTGLVTGIGVGSTTITASLLGTVSSPFPITVTIGFSITRISPNPAVAGENLFAIVGGGFNPATAQVEISNSIVIPNSALLLKTPTRLVFSLNLGRGNERIVVRNGPGGPEASNSVTLNVVDAVNSAQGSHFVPITPCRAVDTRTTAILPARTSRVFSFGNCGVPTNATAVAMNVTLVPGGPLGYLSIWPNGQAQPVVSTMNSLDGRVKANAVVVGLGLLSAVNIFVTDPAHVVLDVNGYFVPQGTPGALAYYPVTPCRVLDTRLAGGTIAALGTRRVSGGCLPTQQQAQAYSLNVTVVPPGPLGFLTLWPSGTPQPTVSTLNAVTGTVVANAAILRAGTDGSFQAYVTEESHFIADVTGYFAPPGRPGALSFFAVPPCRIFDTRDPEGPYGAPRMGADATREFHVPYSGCGVPVSALAYVTNATVIPSGLFGFLTLWPANQSRPTVSTLNAVDGALTSNAAIVSASPGGSIRVYTSNAADLLLDLSGYFAP